MPTGPSPSLHTLRSPCNFVLGLAVDAVYYDEVAARRNHMSGVVASGCVFVCLRPHFRMNVQEPNRRPIDIVRYFL